jgi:hypothetical protein
MISLIIFGKILANFLYQKIWERKKKTTTPPPASYFLVVTRRALRLSDDHLEALTLGPHTIFCRQVDGVINLYLQLSSLQNITTNN